MSAFKEISKYFPFLNSPFDTILLNLPFSILPIKLKFEISSAKLFETFLILMDISLLIFFKKFVSPFPSINFVRLLASYLVPLILIESFKLILKSLFNFLFLKVLTVIILNLLSLFFLILSHRYQFWFFRLLKQIF